MDSYASTYKSHDAPGALLAALFRRKQNLKELVGRSPRLWAMMEIYTQAPALSSSCSPSSGLHYAASNILYQYVCMCA